MEQNLQNIYLMVTFTWDGNDEKTFLSSPGTFPHHFTIDLGVKSTLRKVKLDMPNHLEFNDNNITSLQIWGRESLDGAETSSNTDESFINSGWKLLKEENIDGEKLKQRQFYDRSKSRLFSLYQIQSYIYCDKY